MIYRLLFLVLIFLVGCKPLREFKKEYVYLNQGQLDSLPPVDTAQQVQYIKKGDFIQISVFSETPNQAQVEVFNIPNNIQQGDLKGYKVDAEGKIDFPIIGKVQASGLSCKQLSANIKKMIEPYVARPGVLASFTRYPINVLGEAGVPKQLQFLNYRPNIFDLLANIGDLKPEAIRNEILIIRNDDNNRKAIKLDITKADVFLKEGFYLQQNDMVYLAPNDLKLRQLMVDNSIRQNIANLSGIIGILFFGVNLYLLLNR